MSEERPEPLSSADQDRLLKKIQEKLVDVRRVAFPQGVTVRDFSAASGVSEGHQSTMHGRAKKELKGARLSESSPTIIALAKYLHACGWTLSRFFSELERKSYPSPLPNRKHADLHDRLQRLLDRGGDTERQVLERIEDVENRIKQQPPDRLKQKKRKAG